MKWILTAAIILATTFHASGINSDEGRNLPAPLQVDCPTCIVMFELLDNQLYNPEFQQRVIERIQQVCYTFFGDNQDSTEFKQCMFYIAEYGDDLMELTAYEFIKAQENCANLGFC